MKKFYLLLFVLFVASFSTVHAENILAVRGGMNVASVARNGGGNFETVLGGYAGLQYMVPFNPYFGMQFETTYSYEGYKYIKDRIGFHNLNIPVIFRVNPEKSVHFLAGVQLSVMLSENEIRPYHELKTANCAMVFGFGLNIGPRWEGQVRFNLGVTDLYKKWPDQRQIEHHKTHNHVWQFGLAYKLFKH